MKFATRTQPKNKEDCVSKLQIMIAEAYIEPKDREMWQGREMWQEMF